MHTATFVFTRRDHEGDLRIDGDPVTLPERRQAVRQGAWTWLRQVHGARVVTVTEPGEHTGAEADGAVSNRTGVVLAIHTADCAPVVLHDPTAGVIGAAHVGWRGLVAGVIEHVVDAMVDIGATSIRAVVGPHIRARCYEFGPDDLDVVAARYGGAVRSTTAWDTPALDLASGVRAALAGCAPIDSVDDVGGCTACEPDRYFSHRARGDQGRHAAVISLLS
ncbi:MAG: polyphenol oxidase family protein [Acidimicrobiales bacterium]